MICRHSGATARFRHVLVEELGCNAIAGPPGRTVAIVCAKCGPISLGAAHDAPEVLVEVRAAELPSLPLSKMTPVEQQGWLGCEFWAARCEAEVLAGHLGRTLWDHDEEQRDADFLALREVPSPVTVLAWSDLPDREPTP